MSNSKNYNSIVFLTTLSVYLGLVLVGATPSVLAQQAALTQKFEIKNEIEVEDDLDKNPDDEKLDFFGALESYFNDVENLVEDFQKYRRDKKFDLDSERFDFEHYTGIACNKGGQPVVNGGFLRKIEHSGVESAINSTIYNFDDWETFSDCLRIDTSKSKNYFTNRFKLKVAYDTSQLTIELSVPKSTAQKADYLAERFNQAYVIYEVDEQDILIKSIYQNSFIKSENNQVFIVTNLPRAAIDELLADK